jgi:hypothetical protein
MAVLSSCLKVCDLFHKTNVTPNFKDIKKLFNDKLNEKGLSQVVMILMKGAKYVPQKKLQ